ncbi:MAG: REP-associated tyrosine transposase [Burkholderiales bacterium]|jgi:putative transposase|nr:transposase [Limnohabitans sp.]
MARQPRLALPGYPHHVIQRGNNRQPIVLDEADRRMLYSLWLEESQRHKVAVNAYVLLDNHFHMLLTPPSDEAMSLMMQSVGRTYVRYFNKRHNRSGTLWEGRYKSSLIDSEGYLLTCMAYIDLNPVRAGLAESAEDFSWSSYKHLAGQSIDKLVTPHALYWGLGNTPFAREAAYAEFVAGGLSVATQKALTESALKGRVVGRPDFLMSLEKNTQRQILPQKAGRPFKKLSKA